MAHAFLGWTNLPNTLLILVIALVVPLTAWTLASKLPLWLNVYTIVAVALAFGASQTWFSCKLRFLLPAVLLALPLARALARLRTPVLIPLVGAFAIATTWFGLFLSVIAKLPP